MKETYYFSHDYNAHSDEKVLKLRRKLGMEGYGIYWALIEKLANNEGKLSLLSIDDIAYDLHVDNSVITSVITDFNLFKIDNEEGIFYNKRLFEHLNIMNENKQKKSEAGKKGMAKRWAKHNTTITKNNSVITKDNKIKENKVNKNKINNKKNNSKELGEKVNFSPQTFQELLKENFHEEFINKIKEKYEISPEELKTETEIFIIYWTEKNPNGRKEKWEMEKTFDIQRRFYKWLANNKKWQNGKIRDKKINSYESIF